MTLCSNVMKIENEEPVLSDNPLLLAPWRDELLDLLEALGTLLLILFCCAIYC